MRRTQISARAASNADGDAIRALYIARHPDQQEYAEAIDWSRVEPYWLVAERAGEVIGCIQVAASLPISHVEHMLLQPDLSQRDAAIATKRLIGSALAVAQASGASLVLSTVPYYAKSWKRVLKRKWGAAVVGGANRIVKRLR